MPTTSRTASKKSKQNLIADFTKDETEKHDRKVKEEESPAKIFTLLNLTKEISDISRHSNISEFNLSQNEALDDLSIYPLLAMSAPHSLRIAPQLCDAIDICHKRTYTRSQYITRLESARTRYLNALNKNRKWQTTLKENKYHSRLFYIAEKLQRDPDPFFHGSYDYYYTSGNLCILPQNERRVLFVDGKNLNDLNVASFAHTDISTSQLSVKSTWTDSARGEIFEVRPLRSLKDNITQCFGVRHKDSVTLRYTTADGRSKGLTQFKAKYVPLITFDQAHHEPSIVAVSNMKQEVRLYDIKGQAVMMKLYNLALTNKRQTSDISWNIIRSWKENTFLYANERNLLLMDIRTTPDEWWKSTCAAPDSTSCDYISMLAKSEFSNQVYVATSHKLHMVDMRYLGKNFNEGACICRWTHQLEYPPAFIDTFRCSKNEYVALSSAQAGDICVCEVTRTANVEKCELLLTKIIPRHLYNSHCLPYQPPTMQEVYESARQERYCLRPDVDLQRRITRATTGLSFYPIAIPDSATAMLLYSNSNGDVFAHNCSNRESQSQHQQRVSSEDKCALNNFAKGICELPPPALNFTGVTDLKGMKNIFRYSALNATAKISLDTEVDAANLLKQRPLGRWQKSMQELHTYKDALAQDMLAVWDVDFDTKKLLSLKDIKKKIEPTQQSTSYVESWLKNNQESQEIVLSNTSVTRMNASLESADFFPLSDSLTQTDFNTQNMSNVMKSTQTKENFKQEQELMNSSTVEIHDNSSFLATMKKPTTNISALKKKSKYVKGF